MTIDKSKEPNSIELTSNVLKTCKNKKVKLNAIESGVVAHIPVLLGKFVVELYITHLIKLPEEASNIDTIKNKVFITSCIFLQRTNTLFIDGFIRKKIYYTSKLHRNLRYYKVDIPFKINTIILFNENKLSSENLSNFNQKPIEFFNNQPSCKLISSKICEHCKYIYRKNKDHHIDPLDIDEIIELDNSMTIILGFEMLQNQQVYIKPYYSQKQNSNYYKHKSALQDKSDIKNTPILDNLNAKFKDQNKPDLIDTTDVETKSILFDKTDIEAKPNLDNLCNEDDNANKLDLDYLINLYDKPDVNADSVNDPNLETELTQSDNTNTENKSTLDNVYYETNHNDKLDLDYLLNLYDKPNDELDLVDIPDFKNESIENNNNDINIDNEPDFNNFSNLFNRSEDNTTHASKDEPKLKNSSNSYNKAPGNNRLNFMNLFSLFNNFNNGGTRSFGNIPNSQDKSNLYTKTPRNNKRFSNNYNNCYTNTNSNNNYNSYDCKSSSYKLLILIFIMLIFYNMNNHNSYL